MKKVVIIDKKIGQTPLEALEIFRAKNKAYKDVPMAYAGRLDPMAEGILVVLAGDEAKQKEKYLHLDKEYEFEVLFGFATDTYDVLGKVISKPHRQDLWGKLRAEELQEMIEANLKHFQGTFIQTYPPYSSKTVKGKPLFMYARSGEEVEMPVREVSVQKLVLVKIRKISSQKLLQNIEERVKKVGGDFRQKEILKIWRKNLPASSRTNFFSASFKIKCGSGTYVRSIAHNLGKKINIPALAYSIKRTRVGRYKLNK